MGGKEREDTEGKMWVLDAGNSTMCGRIEAKAVEEARKNIIIDVWLFGSWEQLK